MLSSAFARHLSLFATLAVAAMVAAACGDDSSGLAEAKPGVAQLDPDKFQFPKLAVGQSEDREVTLTNVGEGVIAVKSIQGRFAGEFELFRRLTRGDGETADEYMIDGEGNILVSLPIVLEQNEELVFVLNYKPTSDMEPDPNWAVVLDTNLREDSGRIVIPIVAGASGAEIKVTPVTLDYGRVPAGAEKILETTVTNIGTTPLELQQLLLSGSGDFDVTVNNVDPADDPTVLQDPDGDGNPGIDPAGSVKIQVRYAPETEGPDSGELAVITNDSRTPSVNVNLIANGASPCVVVAPQELSFGAAQVGRATPKVLSIQSCGGQPLEIVGLEIDENSDAAFSLDGESLPEALRQDPQAVEIIPARIEGQDDLPSREIRVLFSPDEERAYEGWVNVRTNDPINEVVTIPLNGRGMINVCPVPEAVNTEFNVLPLDIITLDGTPSVDEDGPNRRPAEYRWTITSRPQDSSAEVVENFFDRGRPADGGPADDPSTATALFFVDLAGEYIIELQVVDELGLAAPSELCLEPLAVVSVRAEPAEDIHIQMVWHTPADADETDAEGSDVDLHFLHPNNAGWMNPPGDCYYANEEPDWGLMGPGDNPSLDIDDTNGAGPENINLDQPENTSGLGGPYKVGVHYYRSREFFGNRNYGPSYVTIRIFLGGILAWENAEPKELRETDDFWEVGGIIWTPNDKRVQLIDRVFRFVFPP